MKDYSVFVGDMDRKAVQLLIDQGKNLGYQDAHKSSKFHDISFEKCTYIRFSDNGRIYFNINSRNQWGSKKISFADFMCLKSNKLKVSSLEHTIELSKCGVTVGCQTITYDDFDEIVDFYQKNKTANQKCSDFTIDDIPF